MQAYMVVIRQWHVFHPLVVNRYTNEILKTTSTIRACLIKVKPQDTHFRGKLVNNCRLVSVL